MVKTVLQTKKDLFFVVLMFILIIPLIYIITLILLPFLLLFLLSIQKNNSQLFSLSFHTLTFQHYFTAFHPLYITVFLRSLWISIVVTFLCFLIGFPTALYLAFCLQKQQIILLTLLLVPFWVNAVVRIYAMKIYFQTDGLINQFFSFMHQALQKVLDILHIHFHVNAFSSLNMLYSKTSVIVALTYVSLPFTILPLYSGLAKFDKTHLESSLDLGAGYWRTLFLVLLPGISSSLTAAFLFTFLPTLGSFLVPTFMGGPNSQMIANVITSQFKMTNDWPLGASLSILFLLLISIMISLFTFGFSFLNKRFFSKNH